MFLAIFQQNPAAAVALLLGLVVGVVVHEAAHAYSAYLLGDDTAYRAGGVTLNRPRTWTSWEADVPDGGLRLG